MLLLCRYCSSLLQSVPRTVQMGARSFRIGLIQLLVGKDKEVNVKRALDLIKEAKNYGCHIVALPECFNSPYGTQYFSQYAEPVPDGPTCKSLSASAVENQIYLIGGSIPESDGNKLYNTCTVWGPTGEMLAKHRKVHLFDIDIPNKVSFKESDTLSPGNSLTSFNTNLCKIGIGICYDIRFEQMARIYRNQGCDVLVYPGAFNMTTGPLHWELLQRARAVDNQVYVTAISPARGIAAGYIAWGYTTLVDPLGQVVAQAGVGEEIVYGDIDLDKVQEFQIASMDAVKTVNSENIKVYVYADDMATSSSLVADLQAAFNRLVE